MLPLALLLLMLLLPLPSLVLPLAAVARPAAAGVASCVAAALSLGCFGSRYLAALEQGAQLLGRSVCGRSAYVPLVHLGVASAARLPIGVPVGAMYGAGALATATTELAARHALEAEAARFTHGLMPSERHLNRSHGNGRSGFPNQRDGVHLRHAELSFQSLPTCTEGACCLISGR